MSSLAAAISVKSTAFQRTVAIFILITSIGLSVVAGCGGGGSGSDGSSASGGYDSTSGTTNDGTSTTTATSSPTVSPTVSSTASPAPSGSPPSGTPPSGSPGGSPSPSSTSSSVTITATYLQDGGTVTKSGQTYESSTTDQSGVGVINAGNLTLTDSTITTSGETTSQENSSFYGLNAGVIATSGSTISMSNCKVTTTGSGGNGVFSTGSGSTVNLTDVIISCTGGGGHGVDATIGGAMTLNNVTITTAGSNGAAIATDRGSGTITVTGGSVKTSGTDSPGIYSTGVITVSGATIAATGSEAAVIEGANSITLTNTTLSGSKKRGVMIYQSMSGDAEGSKGTFTMTGGSLSADVGPLLYVTNATGVISLTGVTLTAASGTLLSAAADSWGTTGSNGGNIVFTADGETMTGSLITDTYSSITATLKNSSTLTGFINSAALSLDATSIWNVTANSVLTSLTDSSGISGTTITNIYGNGYTVTYDSSLSANSALGGLTYTLNGGGTLAPR